MGVVSHRAASGKEASDVIRTTRIHVAVVDLALPLDLLHTTARATELDAPEFTEGGTRLLEILARMAEPPPVVAVKRQRTTRDDIRDLSHALRLGYRGRPHEARDLEVILSVIRRILERHYEGRWPA
jgi:DNA-binding NarL/FixJ family response regulator